jgi:hypothetical protein
MKNIIWAAGIILTTAFVIGCGSNKSDNNANTQPACPVGTIYANGICYGSGGLQQNPAFQYNNGFYADNWTGTTSIQITNIGKMKDFFKLGMGVCDRAGGSSGGSSSCSYYTSGSLDIILQFPTNGMNTAIATVVARPRVNPNFNYQYQIPSGWGLVGAALGLATGVWIPDPKAYYGVEKNPVQLNMEVSVINGNAGFEARSNGGIAGSAMSGTTFGIQVLQGKMEDYSFNFNFLIGGVPAARGTMKRCQNLNCGL